MKAALIPGMFGALLIASLITIIACAKHGAPPKQTAKESVQYQGFAPQQPSGSIHSPLTGNPSSDLLLSLREDQQAATLAKVVPNEHCVPRRAFYMGISDKKAYWSVGCASGNNYQIQIEADQKGENNVIDCTLLVLARIDCFVKLDKQPGWQKAGGQ